MMSFECEETQLIFVYVSYTVLSLRLRVVREKICRHGMMILDIYIYILFGLREIKKQASTKGLGLSDVTCLISSDFRRDFFK